VIGIDEAQFFDEAIVPLNAGAGASGQAHRAGGAGYDVLPRPLRPIPALMAISDDVTKLSAVCMVCGAPAIHTQRLGASRELVVVGAAGVYEARLPGLLPPVSGRAGERTDGASQRADQLRRCAATE